MSAKINYAVIGLILGGLIVGVIYGNPLSFLSRRMQADLIVSGNLLGFVLYWLIPLALASIGYLIGSYTEGKTNA